MEIDFTLIKDYTTKRLFDEIIEINQAKGSEGHSSVDRDYLKCLIREFELRMLHYRIPWE